MARAARSWEVVNSICVEYKCSRIVAPHHFFVFELAMFTNNEKKAESVEMRRAREKKKKFEISRWHQRDTTMWSNFSPSRYHNDQDSCWRGVVWALKAVLSVIRAREAYKKSHKHEIGTIFHFKLSHVITLPFVTRYVDDLFLGSIRCDVIFFSTSTEQYYATTYFFGESTCHRLSRSLHFFLGVAKMIFDLIRLKSR